MPLSRAAVAMMSRQNSASSDDSDDIHVRKGHMLKHGRHNTDCYDCVFVCSQSLRLCSHQLTLADDFRTKPALGCGRANIKFCAQVSVVRAEG